MRFRTILFTLACCLPTLAFAQTSLTGYWKFSVPNGGVSYMELTQNGNAITGAGHGGPTRQITGTLLAGKLHIEIQTGPIAEKRTTEYDAIVQGDKFPQSD